MDRKKKDSEIHAHFNTDTYSKHGTRQQLMHHLRNVHNIMLSETLGQWIAYKREEIHACTN